MRASHYGGGDRPLPASFGEALGGEPGSRADVPAVSRLSPSAAVLDTARLGKATGRDPPGDRGQEELNRRDLLPSRVAGGGGGTATSPPTSTGRACGWCGQPTARPWERSWSWAASAWVQPVASTRTPPDATPRDCASSCSSGPSATPGQSRAATRHVPQRHQNRGRRRDADGGRLRPAGRRGHRGYTFPRGPGARSAPAINDRCDGRRRCHAARSTRRQPSRIPACCSPYASRPGPSFRKSTPRDQARDGYPHSGCPADQTPMGYPVLVSMGVAKSSHWCMQDTLGSDEITFSTGRAVDTNGNGPFATEERNSRCSSCTARPTSRWGRWPDSCPSSRLRGSGDRDADQSSPLPLHQHGARFARRVRCGLWCARQVALASTR